MGEHTNGSGIKDGDIVRVRGLKGDWRVLPKRGSNRIALILHERMPTGRELGGIHVEEHPRAKWFPKNRHVSRASIMTAPVERGS